MVMNNFVVATVVAACLPSASASCGDTRCNAYPGCSLVTYPATGPHDDTLEFECSGAEEGHVVSRPQLMCNFDYHSEAAPSGVCGNVRDDSASNVLVDCYQAGKCTLSTHYMHNDVRCECVHVCRPGHLSDGSECSPCEAGTFKPFYEENQCLPCPEGTTSTVGSARCEATMLCPDSGYSLVADVAQGENGVARSGLIQGSGRWKTEEGCSRYCQRRFTDSIGFQTHGTQDGERGFCKCVESLVLTKEPEAFRVPPRVMQYCESARRLEVEDVVV